MKSNCGESKPRARLAPNRSRQLLASSVLAAAALAAGAGPAAAHGGDAALVHSCYDSAGNVRIIAPDASCKKGENALDWSRAAAGTTYSAGSGLSLSPANVFSVTGAPWSGLTGVPSGFADGVDDEGPALTWGNITGIPNELLDGDDDGSAAVGALRTDLAADDGVPDEAGDPVSFSKIKDLTSMSGDGRITGTFVRDGSIANADLADDAVDGDTIADGSVTAEDLAPGVLQRSLTTTTVDPAPIPAGARVAVSVTAFGATFAPEDIVTVSPPPNLEPGLVYAGSDVLPDGTLTIYLHNITAGAVDGMIQTWTIRQLKTSA
jgi:hypothetical protein